MPYVTWEYQGIKSIKSAIVDAMKSWKIEDFRIWITFGECWTQWNVKKEKKIKISQKGTSC